MTSENGDGSPTPLCDESGAIDCQPVVCISPVVESQLVDARSGVLCPVVVEVPEAVAVADGMDGAEVAVEGEAAHDEDGAIVFDGLPAEWREARLPPDVPVPSREMVRRHRAAGHCPYKSWCKHCVANAANAPGHHPRAPISDVPEVHCDYAFFRDRRGDKENTATVLVVKDRGSKAFGAIVVPKKGTGDGFAVKQFDREIRRFGHRGAITLRGDGEMAVKDLLDCVASYRVQKTNIEHTPVGDSRANGLAERAVQSIEKQVRIIKSSTEEVMAKFGVKHAAFPWLVMHASMCSRSFSWAMMDSRLMRRSRVEHSQELCLSSAAWSCTR